MNVITLKLNNRDISQLYEAFKEYQADKTPAYAHWQLKPENCVITAYQSGKVVFQGKDAEIYASPFQTIPNNEKYPQAGSDEVGTGDYFGPVCVAAAIVNEKDIKLLESLGVKDSKAVTDGDILKIAPQLMNQLVYSLLIVTPEKYNQVHQHNNMNAIKAKLHNMAYINLSNKTELPAFKVIDQFAPEPVYYSYLKSEPKVIRGIHFETKAENKYLAVAAASIIARYSFLKTMEQMGNLWGMTFHKGAGKEVDICGADFIKKHSQDQLYKVAKLHFKNSEKIMENH